MQAERKSFPQTILIFLGNIFQGHEGWMSSGSWFTQAVFAPQARKQLPLLDLAGHTTGCVPAWRKPRYLPLGSCAGGTLRGWASSGWWQPCFAQPLCRGKGAWNLQGQPAHGVVAAPQHLGNFRGQNLALYCVTLKELWFLYGAFVCQKCSSFYLVKYPLENFKIMTGFHIYFTFSSGLYMISFRAL